MEGRRPRILALDTATSCCAVALTAGTRQDGRVLAALSLTGSMTHSRRIFTAIDYLMQETGIDWPAIDGLAVSLGPGSFTGLRIGMATAKGLAAATGKPLLGVSTLDALAASCLSQQLVCAVLDARKKEVYAALYRRGASGLAERLGEPAVMTPERLAAAIDEPVLLVGDGAVVYSELFRARLADRVRFAPAQLNSPSAAALGLLAAELLAAGRQLDVAEAVPIYIRSSDAELNLQNKRERMKKVGNQGW